MKVSLLSQCDSEPELKGNYKYMEDVHRSFYYWHIYLLAVTYAWSTSYVVKIYFSTMVGKTNRKT